MRGVASETGSMSPTIVAKIVIDNIMVTPGRNPASINQKERRDVTPYQFMVTRAVLNREIRTVEDFYRVSNFPANVSKRYQKHQNVKTTSKRCQNDVKTLSK